MKMLQTTVATAGIQKRQAIRAANVSPGSSEQCCDLSRKQLSTTSPQPQPVKGLEKAEIHQDHSGPTGSISNSQVSNVHNVTRNHYASLELHNVHSQVSNGFERPHSTTRTTPLAPGKCCPGCHGCQVAWSSASSSAKLF